LKFQKLCNEFNVQSTDFCFKGGDNGSLGTIYSYWTNRGDKPFRGIPYNPKKMQFIEQSSCEAIKKDYVYQEAASES
jgi:hypothetical protein